MGQREAKGDAAQEDSKVTKSLGHLKFCVHNVDVTGPLTPTVGPGIAFSTLSSLSLLFSRWGLLPSPHQVFSTAGVPGQAPCRLEAKGTSSACRSPKAWGQGPSYGCGPSWFWFSLLWLDNFPISLLAGSKSLGTAPSPPPLLSICCTEK